MRSDIASATQHQRYPRWCYAMLMTSLTTPLTTHVIRMLQIYYPPQKLGCQIPSIFCRGYLRDNPQNPENFVKNLTNSFWEIFWNQSYSFWGPLYRGVQMLRLFFWVLKGPQLHKKFWAPRTSYSGDMRVKVSTFPPFPPKLGGHIPSIFCTGILGMTPKTLKVLWKSCKQFPRYLAFYCPSLWPR